MIVQTLLGSSAEPAHASTLQVGVGGLIVFGFAMVVARVGARRLQSEAAPFGVILGVTLGAMLGMALSVAINGPPPIIPAMICLALLVIGYRLAGRVSLSYRGSGDMGRSDADAIQRSRVSEPDLREVRRFESGVADLTAAGLATVGRGGHIGVVHRR